MNKLKKGDIVKIMRGKDAGKKGEILSVVEDRVVVKGINIVKKTQKPNPQLGITGGISEIEKSIDASNVMYIDKKLNKPSRIGFKIDEKTGRRVRFSKKSGETI